MTITTITALLVLSLRAAYFVSCGLAFFAYGGGALYSLETLMRRRVPSSEDVMPLILWISSLGGMVFVGKRVLMAIFLGQQITFDRGPWDAAGTAFGLFLLTASEFLAAWMKARWNGNVQYGRYALGLVVISSLGFATFYWFDHNVLSQLLAKPPGMLGS